MPRITSDSQNVHAFLDMLASSEIGLGLLEHSDNGYDVLVGSTSRAPLLFTSCAKCSWVAVFADALSCSEFQVDANSHCLRHQELVLYTHGRAHETAARSGQASGR